jgi:polysaccharide export outer membrane protein
MQPHSRLRALVFGASCVLLAVASTSAAAQQPTQAQIERALATNPNAASTIRERIRTSGLTPDQIRQRLRAAGYSEKMLDQYLGAAADTSAAPSDSIYSAVTALGLVDRQEAAALQSGQTAVSAIEAPMPTMAKTPSAVFGLNVFRQQTSQFQPDIAGPVDPSYKVGPRDVLALIITGGVEASYSLEVTREGFVVVPQVGQVFVANLTLDQINEVMFRRLRSVYSGIGRGTDASTRFYVTVVKLRTNQVFVVGEANAPASYQVSSVGTMLTALYGAGGPSDIGSLRAIELRRAGQVVSTLDVYDYLIRGDASGDLRLETGDVVFVPMHGPHVAVTGEVKRPSTYELKPGETLRDAIMMAGGFTATAGRRRVLVTRVVPPGERTAGGRDRTVLDITSDELTSGLGPAVPLADGDSVQIFPIAERQRNALTVDGAVWNPGPQGFEPGMRLSAALQRAGGVRPEVKDVIIKRLQSDQTLTTLRAAFTDTLGALANDPVLQEDDSIRVYATTDFRPDRFVAINGAVKKDGRYPWREGLTLRDLVHEAGGFEDGAYLVHAEVARLPETRQAGMLARTVTVPLDSTYLLERGLDGKYVGPPGIPAPTAVAPDFVLSPYDNVLILRQPEWLLERRVTILGEVQFPGTYALLSKSEKLTSLISRAGGVLPSGYPEAAVLMRPSRAVGRVGFDLKEVLSDSGARDNFVMEPGDTLSIPRFIPTVQVRGAVNSPIAVAYVPGKRLKYYVDAAGGDTYLADFGRAYVRQPNGIVEPYKRRFLWPDANPKAQAGAEVVVPSKDPDDRKDWTAIAGSIAQITASVVAIIVVVTR